MAFNIIPDHTFSSQQGVPEAQTLAGSTPSPSEQQLTLAAANAPIRFGYGPARVGPLVANALVNGVGDMLLDCVLGEGPTGSLLAVQINDAAPPAGVTWTYYNGTQSAPDSQLVAAWLLLGVNYTDVRPGIAYVVLKIPAATDVALDERSLTFEFEQRRTFDPRVTFRQVQSDLATGWTDVGTPGVIVNGAAARDGTMTASIFYDNTPGTPSGRRWTWTVANDTKMRAIALSVNKAPTSHTPGIGVEYLGGGTPRSYFVRLNTVTGIASLASGTGGAVAVIDRTTHWEVVLALANNATGNTSFRLTFYANLP
jgi:hypothetical protein